MKILSIMLTLALTGCSVEPYDPNRDDPNRDQEKNTTEEEGLDPLKDVCSYRNDRNKGCLKATISNSELRIGDFHYEIGVKQFAREFGKDLAADHDLHEVVFSRNVTPYNFYSNFLISVEGSHTNYAAYHTGLGNLQVNSMASGYYNVLLSKEFELRALDVDGKTTDYICAIMWTRRPINILPGQETALPEPIGDFNIEIYAESCNGKKVEDSESPFAD